jgi:hypothetical protein
VPIVFSDHAKFQLKKRRISQNRIIETIRNPQEIIPSFRGRKLRRRPIGDKMLEVVTKTEGPRMTVITGYYLEE